MTSTATHVNCGDFCPCWASGYKEGERFRREWEHQTCLDSNARCLCFRRGVEHQKRWQPRVFDAARLAFLPAVDAEGSLTAFVLKAPDFTLPITLSRGFDPKRDFVYELPGLVYSWMLTRWHENRIPDGDVLGLMDFMIEPASLDRFDDETVRDHAWGWFDEYCRFPAWKDDGRAWPDEWSEEAKGDDWFELTSDCVNRLIDRLFKVRFQAEFYMSLIKLERPLFAEEDPRKALAMVLREYRRAAGRARPKRQAKALPAATRRQPPPLPTFMRTGDRDAEERQLW